MDTRKLAMALIAAERHKVDDLIGVDMPVLLEAAMSNWQEYHRHHDVYEDGSRDAKSALQAVRQILDVLAHLLTVQYILDEARDLIEGTCSLHEEQELLPQGDG